jgi:glucan phosphoethanolaminetransferase (alkaline phosphatase superfamily)
MIQRKQSVYLFLIAVLSLLFFSGSIVNFINESGSVYKITFDNIIKGTEGQGLEIIQKLLPLMVLIILIPIISLITLFIFKNRKIQLKLTIFLMILCTLLVIALIHGSIITISKFGASLTPGFKMILPLIMLILSILAYRGIKKDDQLVKSYDRLR